MSIKVPKQIIFILSFLVSLALYWPSIKGTPIWDDFTYWFQDPVMEAQMKYSTIWLNFAWPFSVSLQKMLLSLWKNNYTYYHLFNFVLHFANSLLVYKLGRYFRFKYPLIFFLLFLLHPVCVITTAWMIQIKTLLCFFFGLASLLAFLKGNKNIRWMIGAWVLFALSIASKSASLTLPAILLLISYRTYRFSKIHLLIPFFLLSGWSAYRVLTSPVTFEGAQKAAVLTKVKDTPAPVIAPRPEPAPAPASPKVEVKPKPEPVIKKVKPKKIVKPKLEPKVEVKPEEPKQVEVTPLPPPPPKPEKKSSFKFITPDFGLISQTLNYYFWQVLLPIQNAPVKGLNFKKANAIDLLHIIFLACLIVIFRKGPILIYLAAAHFMLLPFLGIMPAPYMNITWVSDQHLYLALPALLAVWMKAVELIKWKYAWIIPGLFVIYFGYETYETTPIYKNNFSFYESSLDYNPYNVPIAYNLAFARLMNGEFHKSFEVLESTYLLSVEEPLIRRNIYYPNLLELYLQLKDSAKK